MVELKNVTKSYQNKKILDNVSFCFDKKGIYNVIGVSGSGKTTLLNAIYFNNVDGGKIVCGESIFYLPVDEFLIDEFNVKEMICLHKQIYVDFKEYKNRFNIDEFINTKISKLSKGEKKRLGLFLALSSNCKILLFDEPLSGVDEKWKKEIISEIKKVSRNKLVIVASHQNIKNTRQIQVKDGNVYGDNNYFEFENKSFVNKLNKTFKWGMLLHFKQWFSRLIFISSILGIGLSSSYLINNSEKLYKESLENIHLEEVYYKNNDAILNKDNFYSHVVSKVANQVYDYYYNFYSDEAYNARVIIHDKLIADGSVFSNIYNIENLRDDEIVLEINKKDFCLNNNYSYCYQKQLIEDLKGRKLSYIYNDKEEFFKVKDVIVSDVYRIYSSNREFVIEKLSKLYNNCYFDFYLVIYKNKIQEFYQKINNDFSLLNYDFTKIYDDENYEYFFVNETKESYFSYSELSDNNLMACNDIIISCNSFEFLTFSSLIYIDDYNMKNKIRYDKLKDKLSYNEVIISSSLSNSIKKMKNEKINLKFYIDETFYVLNDVLIKDVINSDELVIYHSDYDLNLFKDKFNKFIRIKYAYSNQEQNYKKKKILGYEMGEEVNKIALNFVIFTKIFVYIVSFVSIMILFILENSKFNKHISFFKVINDNRVNVEKVFFCYALLYFEFGLVFAFNFVLFIIYIFWYLLFYFLIRRKIKSRFPWI